MRVKAEMWVALASLVISIVALYVSWTASPLSDYVRPRIEYRLGEATFQRHTEHGTALWRIDVTLTNPTQVTAEKVQVTVMWHGEAEKVAIHPKGEIGREDSLVGDEANLVVYDSIQPSETKKLMFFRPLLQMPDSADVVVTAKDLVTVTHKNGRGVRVP